MKKNYFMLAAAVTLFAACAETDMVEEVNDVNVPQAIGFDAFANKVTRAEMDANLVELKRTGFKVWGYKSHDNYNYTVFDGVTVTWKAATNDVAAHWGYENTKYWDETATYNFYAVAPVDNQSSISNGKIRIENVASAHVDDSKDYLIDRAGNTGIAGSAKAVQSFDFNHIMAKLSFVLKANADIKEKITVTSLKMSGWDNAEGTFNQTLTETPDGTISAEEWDLETPAVPGEFVVVNSNLPINSTGVDVENKYIVVPQVITYTPAATDNSGNVTPESGLTFTISYVIGDDVNTGEVFTEQVGVVGATQTWGTDTHTIYTITVGPAAIEFDVNSVAGWTNDPNNVSGGTIE